jgi:5-formyltetrahydrofolate cyclo-ligase
MNAISKNILRNQAKDIRNGISQSRRESDSTDLKQNIIVFLNSNRNLVIGAYYPIGSEIIPPHDLDGYQMALPVIRNKTTLEFYEWVAGDPLVTKDFSIPIPDTRGKSPVVPDILLLPLLLCDASGNRIGYGAGHCDRYIASCKTSPLLIGVCFEDQIYDGDIPAEPHDQALDLIITPKRVIEIS